MATSEQQNETVNSIKDSLFHHSEKYGYSNPKKSELENDTNIPWTASTGQKMHRLTPSSPRHNFYKDYHPYMAVIFISMVLAIIVCSVIYVGIRKRKYKRKLARKRQRRRFIKRPLSRQSSSNALSYYESFASRRSNNKHARLTSQRSWADSPLTGIESPFYEEMINKSLPSSLKSEDICLSQDRTISRIGSPIGHRENSSGSISDDPTSSTSELAKYYNVINNNNNNNNNNSNNNSFNDNKKPSIPSPCFDFRSESVSPDSVSENVHRHIPLTKLKSSQGIIVQISSMDLISTAIPRSPFSARKNDRKNDINRRNYFSSGTKPRTESPPQSVLDSPSLEFKPLVTISEEAQGGQLPTTTSNGDSTEQSIDQTRELPTTTSSGDSTEQSIDQTR